MSTSIVATPRPVRRAHFTLSSDMELPLWLRHNLETEDLDVVAEGTTGGRWVPKWKAINDNIIELILQPEALLRMDSVIVRITG